MAPPRRRRANSKMAALIAVSGRGAAHSKMAACRKWLMLGGVRFYNAPRLRLKLGGVYLPDPTNPRTPSWQLEASYEPKLFARYGAASGVDPARLWPTPEQLKEIEAEEREWYPPLRDMEAALDVKEREAELRKRQREEVIAAKMAKMPQMIADWRQEKAERKAKELAEKEWRQQLLAEARERFGHNLDHRSSQFQELVEEMEKARRKERKLQKKQLREQAIAQKAAETATAASSPDKEGGDGGSSVSSGHIDSSGSL
ncbi:growth arrest and DNA damage-inducible proteins-interacting protein 1 [Hemicordylus capensis]|uniref:growth arrest and DNA damage-inducible proteins-interacting protein 1 n=1 Tax=Hemicordylus capensis TaxID=884348 RepID=UPI0023042D73|nr:growth arrest and DNA damage-inducible proteins-interacting protein 1 [Hemicordylus capensis]